MDQLNQTDENANFVALLTAGQNAIAMIVRSLMPGEHAADEVIAQTNAKLWQKRDEFELGTNFRAWASAIAHYEVLNYRKQQARDARLMFSDELQHQIVAEVTQLVDQTTEQQLALRKCLNELNPKNRELLLSRYQSDEPLTQLAARTGRSIGGIRVTLCRLRSFLADCIQRRLIAEER